MTGKEIHKQVMEALAKLRHRLRGEPAAETLIEDAAAALAPCTVLTPEEADDVMAGIQRGKMGKGVRRRLQLLEGSGERLSGSFPEVFRNSSDEAVSWDGYMAAKYGEGPFLSPDEAGDE